MKAGTDTRQAILEAALELFAERGFAGASLRAIGRAAGVRETAFYHYFPSKEALFYGVLEYVQARRAGALFPEAARVAKLPLRAGLTRLAHAALAHYGTPLERRFFRLVAKEIGRLRDLAPDERRALFVKPRAAFVQLYEALARAGRVRDDLEPETVMMHFIMPLLLIGNLAHLPRIVDVSPARLLKEHVEFVASALEPRPRRATGVRGAKKGRRS